MSLPMHRTGWYAFGLAILLFSLAACGGNTAPSGPAASTSGCKSGDVKVNEGETADIGCLKLTVVDSQFANSQLNVNLSITNLSDTPLALKVNDFTATDSSKTNGLPTTCAGTGGFSGALAKNEKLDSHACWFLAGATPPITISYGAPGGGNIIVQLKPK